MSECITALCYEGPHVGTGRTHVLLASRSLALSPAQTRAGRRRGARRLALSRVFACGVPDSGKFDRLAGQRGSGGGESTDDQDQRLLP